jgi:hypothetical protein
MAEAVRIPGPTVGPGMELGGTDTAGLHSHQDLAWARMRGWRLDDFRGARGDKLAVTHTNYASVIDVRPLSRRDGPGTLWVAARGEDR